MFGRTIWHTVLTSILLKRTVGSTKARPITNPHHWKEANTGTNWNVVKNNYPCLYKSRIGDPRIEGSQIGDPRNEKIKTHSTGSRTFLKLPIN
jgi:hypothetical protein